MALDPIDAGDLENLSGSLRGPFFFPIDGACHRVHVDDTAFAHREAAFSLVLSGSWKDPADNEKNKGVHNMTWSPEMLAVFEQAWLEGAAEQSAKDAFFKKVWEDLSAFRAEYAIWGKLGYLPRNCSVGQ